VLKRALTLITALTFVALGSVTGASATADPYPPGCAIVDTGGSSFAPGTTITITATGDVRDAGHTITFTITLTSTATATVTPADTTVIVITAVADAHGVAVVSVTAPTTPGVYTVTITNIICGEVSSSFIVKKPDDPTPPVDPNDPDLPHAGTNVQQWLVTSSAAVAVGLGLWIVARRRRRTTSQPAT